MLLGPCHYLLGNACGTMSLQFGQCLRDHAVTLLAKFCKKNSDLWEWLATRHQSPANVDKRHMARFAASSSPDRLSVSICVKQEIADDVARLTQLRHLDASYNLIETLDVCLLDQLADRLLYFNLRENPFHCDPDCALQTRLRRAYFRLVKRWVVERRVRRGRYRFQKDRGPLTTAPFVPGKCWTPVELRGSSVIDWKCLGDRRAVPVSLSSLKCNNILRWTQVLHFNLKKNIFPLRLLVVRVIQCAGVKRMPIGSRGFQQWVSRNPTHGDQLS